MKRERVKLHIIGNKIKELRKIKNITQADLASALDVSIDTIKNWEQGYNYPTIDKLYNLANFFNCNYDFLFGNQQQPVKNIEDISKHTGISYNSVQKLIQLQKSENPIVEIISQIISDDELLTQLTKCCFSDYGYISTTMTIHDPFRNHECNLILNPEDLRKADLLNLYNSLSSFVQQIYEKKKQDDCI